MVVIELVQYKLKPDKLEEDFKATFEQVLKNFLEKQPGFKKPWEIFKSTEDVWTEIVRWETREDAKKAADPSIHGPCQDFFSFMDKPTVKFQYLEEKQIFD